MREKSLPSPRPDVSLYREFQYLVLCFISVLLVFPNDSYYIITTFDLSTAFFTFFQFFSTILDSMNFQAFTTIKTAVNVRRTDSTFHYLCVLFHLLYTNKMLSSNYNCFIKFQTQFLFDFLFFKIAD